PYLLYILHAWNSGCYCGMTQAETECNLSEGYIRVNQGFEAVNTADRSLKDLTSKNTSAPIATRKCYLLVPQAGKCFGGQWRASNNTGVVLQCKREKVLPSALVKYAVWNFNDIDQASLDSATYLSVTVIARSNPQG